MNIDALPVAEPRGTARTEPVGGGLPDEPVFHDATHTRYHDVVCVRASRVFPWPRTVLP